MYLQSNSAQILAYKKTDKITHTHTKKNTLFYPTFQCRRYSVFKKMLTFFFDPEKVKKQASKIAHNWPNPFFSQFSPDHSPQPRIEFSYYEISGPDSCSLICVSTVDFYKFI
jgi:hypothetical protein